MTQSKPQTYMRRLFLFWNAADAVLARRGLKPLTYNEALSWFDCEIEPEDVPEVSLKIGVARRLAELRVVGASQ